MAREGPARSIRSVGVSRFGLALEEVVPMRSIIGAIEQAVKLSNCGPPNFTSQAQGRRMIQRMNARSLNSLMIRSTLSSTGISCVGSTRSGLAGGSKAALTPGNWAIRPASAAA